MATTPPPPTGGMIDRIKNILLSPRTEWDRIDAEPMTEQGIFTGWVLPLAAIGPVCALIGGQVFGYGAFGINYKPPLTGAIITAVLTYVLAVAGIWVLAKIIDALAPSFDGLKNPVAATKVVAFSYTASFLAGVFGLIPMLGIIGGLLGLYSLYLLYLGLPKLMKAPQQKALGYTVVAVLCSIVLYFVIAFVAAAVATAVAGSAMSAAVAGTTVGGTMKIGDSTVDLAKLKAAADTAEANAKAMEAAATGANPGAAGAVTATDPNKLQALLPAAAAGWTRGSVESSSAGAAGVAGSTAKGEYSRGSDAATLTVTDMGAMGAMAAMAGALNVTSSKTTATGYEKTGTVDGRMTTEKWDGTARRGTYSTIVANRFVVEVDGAADSADTLKALAASVPIGTLEGMAK